MEVTQPSLIWKARRLLTFAMMTVMPKVRVTKGIDGKVGGAACGVKYGQVSGSKRQRGGSTGAGVVVDAGEPQWVPWELPSVIATTASEEALPCKSPRKLPPRMSTNT